MSFVRLPSKSEVMGWNPHNLADFLKKRDMPGCDKVVLKNSMNGSRFLNMSENDLQNFPKVHAPLISKICSEINRKEEKRGLFCKRTTLPKYHQPETPSEGPGWDADEFDTDDYESPDEGDDRESDGDYDSPSEEIENGGGSSDNDYEPPPSEPPEEMPRTAIPMVDSDYIDNRRSVDNRRSASSTGQPPVPSPRPSTGPPLPTTARPSLSEPPGSQSREQSPHFPTRLPAPPAVDRNKKPTSLERGLNLSPNQSGRKPNTVDRLPTHSWRPKTEEKVPEPLKVVKPPLPSSAVNRSNSSVTRLPLKPRYESEARHEAQDEGSNPKQFGSNTFPLPSRTMPPRPSLCEPAGSSGLPKHADSGSLPLSMAPTGSLPSRLQEVLNVHRSNSRVGGNRRDVPSRPAQVALLPPQPSTQYGQDMDSRWYTGQVTRGQAEGCLRQVNKDGAYLVRDSSKQSWEQPFTLMVLYLDKVYNIQIRRQENQYMLGTGLKVAETFSSVADIIQHYSQSPLLLIDAKNRGSAQQNQCPLIYPAGY